MMHTTCPQTGRSRPARDPAISALHRWLCGDLSDAALHGVLDELRASTEWIVLEPFDRPPERIVQMVYRPTGTPYAFRARQVRPGLWHFADESSPRCRYSPYEAD